MLALSRIRTTVAVLALAGCQHSAQTTRLTQVDRACRSHCAEMQEKCVSEGMAKQFGLPGVTHDLCRRELEDCHRACRAITEQEPKPVGKTTAAATDGVH